MKLVWLAVYRGLRRNTPHWTQLVVSVIAATLTVFAVKVVQVINAPAPKEVTINTTGPVAIARICMRMKGTPTLISPYAASCVFEQQDNTFALKDERP